MITLDPRMRALVTDSFERQGLMSPLGVRLTGADRAATSDHRISTASRVSCLGAVLAGALGQFGYRDLHRLTRVS